MSLDTHIDADEITKKIKDGSYFTDAKEWYFEKFIFSISQRSFLIILLGVCVYMVASLYLNYTILTGISDDRPFTIYTQDTATQLSILHPVGSENSAPQIAVAKYLISDYLETRERFIPGEMTDENYPYMLKKIKSASSKPVLDEYKNYMNKLNPYSPFTRYRDNTIRRIEINDFRFLTNNLTNGKALVTFTAIEEHSEKEPTTSQWQAQIHFRIPDIEAIAQTQSPLRFLVKYYHVTPKI